MVMTAVLAKECQEQRAEYIESCQASGENAQPIHPGGALEGSSKNFVLAEEARKGWNARDGDACAHQREERDGCVLAKPAHLTQVLLTAQGMNHATRT